MDSIPTEPRPIKKLDKTLINRIAAGEIIHRPASALKELIENSLDAGSTSIKVTVKDGGLKLLQIQDNGCGIRKSDLPILAERFTTSKLSSFSDLQKIATYGFRGEALASISHVARLSVVTKTKKESCAWKAHYLDGALVSSKPGRPAEPEPCAGNDGTTIIVENLFYNTPTRLSALRNNSEEYARILDVMTKYAIHNPKVSFMCKKSGSGSPELSTPPNSDTPQSIRLLYGHSIAKELLHTEVGSSGGDDDMDVDEADVRKPKDEIEGDWSAEVYFTNPNYQAKKFNFLLFINHRMVESPRMKRALEAAYHSILPKGASPFVYLSLEIDPKNVDVNVHPTKREVHFLYEEEITDRICSAVQKTLSAKASSRSFEYQTLLTSHITSTTSSSKAKGKWKAVDDDEDEEMQDVLEDDGEEEVSAGKKRPLEVIGKTRTYSHHKVRTSLTDRTLDSMFPVVNPNQKTSQSKGTLTGSTSEAPIELESEDEGAERGGMSDAGVQSTATASTKTRDVPESVCILSSVHELRREVVEGKHERLTEIVQKSVFVGIVDLERCLALIQHSTSLYLVNYASLAEEAFYQLALRQFGDFPRLRLDPAPSLRRLIEIAIEVEDTSESRLSKPKLVEKITNLLMSKREMLTEYFAMDITEEGDIQSIPLLLRDYIPNLDGLPGFLMRLGPQVEWNKEKECFESFLRELAYFYTPLTFPEDIRLGRAKGDSEMDGTRAEEEDKEREKAERWQIEHVLFPAMRKYMIAPKSLLDGDIVQVASLPDLYKVFERC
ncbi:DNA binding protein [Coprinopsis cinerea okayama7|uniref:DNA binding protein n=1 Tax=Coprinopsis cinerea (strain Okayama-7 / 130 / ATCC MYA-4618 / FGSC 9003) TaxID=240176 RepID=A8PCM6_COPC7|nr:DNA binding protein [Coprinopsis cinerea okayama7\|eukprot:XP_001840436.2 DNA binding protein [Coprinopsis cinerea okayama7\